MNETLIVLEALLVIVALVILALGIIALGTKLISRPSKIGKVEIGALVDSTQSDQRGAVRSVQSADMQINSQRLDEIWTPMHLERLASTYWRFLTRCTLGLIQIEYTEEERFVVLICRPFVLLAFRKPEYQMDDVRGIVRWRIERGNGSMRQRSQRFMCSSVMRSCAQLRTATSPNQGWCTLRISINCRSRAAHGLAIAA